MADFSPGLVPTNILIILTNINTAPVILKTCGMKVFKGGFKTHVQMYIFHNLSIGNDKSETSLLLFWKD